LIGLCFLSSALPFINIYVCTKLNFDLFGTFQDMARTGIHYDKWLWGDNSTSIKGMIMVLEHCPFSHCHLSTNHVSFKSLKNFQRHGPDRHPLCKINGYVDITQQIYRVGLWSKFHLNANSSFKVVCRTRYRIDRRTKRTICFPFWEHKKLPVV